MLGMMGKVPEMFTSITENDRGGILSIPDGYNGIVKDNYRGFDLEGHGCAKLPDDLRLVRFIMERYREKIKSGRVLVLGAGPGRLATTITTLCRQLGATDVVFNDLLPIHVAKTRQRIGEVFGDDEKMGSLRMGYSIGDLREVIEGQFDLILSLWFVDGELMPEAALEANDPRAFLEERRSLRKYLGQLLRKDGVMVVESPYSGVGDYWQDNLAARLAFPTIHDDIVKRLILTSFTEENKKFANGGAAADFHLRVVHGGVEDVLEELYRTGLSLIEIGKRQITRKTPGAIQVYTVEEMNRITGMKGGQGMKEGPYSLISTFSKK